MTTRIVWWKGDRLPSIVFASGHYVSLTKRGYGVAASVDYAFKGNVAVCLLFPPFSRVGHFVLQVASATVPCMASVDRCGWYH